MREEDPTSSATPDTLFAFRDGMRDVDAAFRAGALARVRTTLDDFLRSCPDYGSAVPHLDVALTTHVARAVELGDWVAAVGLAFFEAGDGPRRRHSHDPDDAGWDGGATWSADDGALADQLFADSAAVAAERERAARLAEQLLNAGDLGQVRRVMAELAVHDGDVVFAAAFFNRLGPGMTLVMERDLVEMTRYERYQGWQGPDPVEELLRPFDEAFATATRGSARNSLDNLEAGFVSSFLNDPYVTPADLSNLMQLGFFSTDFLVLAGHRMLTFSRDQMVLSDYTSMVAERWPGVQNSGFDPRVAVLAAISRDPSASLNLLDDRDIGRRLMALSGDSEQGALADLARAAIFGGAGTDLERNEVAFHVMTHYVARPDAPATMRHVLADIVAAHVGDLARSADIQVGGGSALNPDGSFYMSLTDLQRLLHLATKDTADTGRVLDATSSWAATLLAQGGGADQVGRMYRLLARAGDVDVTEAAASDERRKQFAESISRIVGMIPVPGGSLLSLAGDGVKTLIEDRVKAAGSSDDASAAMLQANTFNDSIVDSLDYLAAATSFAHDPAALSRGVQPLVLVVNDHAQLAPPYMWREQYQAWYLAHSGDEPLRTTRMDLQVNFAARRQDYGGR